MISWVSWEIHREIEDKWGTQATDSQWIWRAQATSIGRCEAHRFWVWMAFLYQAWWFSSAMLMYWRFMDMIGDLKYAACFISLLEHSSNVIGNLPWLDRMQPLFRAAQAFSTVSAVVTQRCDSTLRRTVWRMLLASTFQMFLDLPVGGLEHDFYFPIYWE